jgi:hypothetical protein
LCLFSVFIVFLVVAGNACALSVGDVIDWIRGLLGLGGDEVICNPPYMRLGDICCLDADGNGICDSDEMPKTTRATTTRAQTTTTAAGQIQTAARQTTTTLATNLRYETVSLIGGLVPDVDPILFGGILIQPTSGGYLEFIDLATGAHDSVRLSGEILSGVDAVALSSGVAVIPVMKDFGILDFVDIAGRKLIKSVPLTSRLQVDVDVEVSPDESKLIIKTRSNPSNSFIEVVDVNTYMKRSANLQGDLKEGVDALIYSDGSKAVAASLRGTGVGSSVSFIDLQSASILRKVDIDGRLEEDVDMKLTGNDEILIVPTRTPTLGYLTILDAKTMNVKRKLTLSGTLKESADPYFLPGERRAYIPVYSGAQGYLDIIDLYGGSITHSVRLTGNIIKGVDARQTPDGSLILAPTQKGTKAYLDIVEPGSGTLKASVELTSLLKESVDVQISEDGKTAYMPTAAMGLAYVDIIDLASAKIVKTIDWRGSLVEDLDAQLTSGEGTYAAASEKGTGYMTLIRNIPSKSLVCLTTAGGMGTVTAIDLSTNDIFGTMTLPGNVVPGVDAITTAPAKTTPHHDEDMVVRAQDQTIFTTTTHPAQTTITITSDTTTTTAYTPGMTTTTISDMVITPRCGDGYLSWSGSPGGGSEECDPNTGPGNDWVGAQRYDCPPGLTCVNCKCVGCGDGRLQAGEECDPNNKYSTINGQRLWSGVRYPCEGEYEICDSNCRCTSSIQCSGDLYESSNCDNECTACDECIQYPGTPCYYCSPINCNQLPGGWSSSVRCDGNHETVEYHPECPRCIRCKTVCPKNLGYYTTQTCGGRCITELCNKIGGTGEYKDCYRCADPVCGDGIRSPGEECETDGHCSTYHTCINCECITDCDAYCASMGSGYTYHPGAVSQDDCGNNNDPNSMVGQAVSAISQTCCASCGKAYYREGRTANCCCIKTNKVCPCSYCPCREGIDCHLMTCEPQMNACQVGL